MGAHDLHGSKRATRAVARFHFFIPHSSFDILHFGLRTASKTEMKNVE